MRTVNQGEPLIQEHREIERNTGTDAIREAAIASESMDVNEAEKERLFQQHYKAEIESISLDADTFTHPVSAYQILAAQGNEGAERLLNLVHTTESMLKDKAAINQMPSVADDDLSEEFGDDSDDDEDLLTGDAMNIGGDEGPSSSTTFPGWALAKECNPTLFNASIVRQMKATIQ